MSDPNRAPCPTQGRDHVQLLVLPCALMVLGPPAAEQEQLEAALKGCSEVGGVAQHALGCCPLPCCPLPCRVLLQRISAPAYFSAVPSTAGSGLLHRALSQGT